jgi:hypothetical protein
MQGSVSYDVATMRMAYQRLKWDSSAIQKVLYGDTTHGRRIRSQAMAIWNLANVMIRSENMRGIFTSQQLHHAQRTSVDDLVEMGYTLRGTSSDWTREEVKNFFRACRRYRQTGMQILGSYADVYDWIAYSIMKGGRTPQQVRAFATTVFNARKKRKKVHDGADKSDTDDDIEDLT